MTITDQEAVEVLKDLAGSYGLGDFREIQACLAGAKALEAQAAPPAPPVTVTDEMVERALKAWWSRMGDRGRSDDQLMRETLLAALGDKP